MPVIAVNYTIQIFLRYDVESIISNLGLDAEF